MRVQQSIAERALEGLHRPMQRLGESKGQSREERLKETNLLTRKERRWESRGPPSRRKGGVCLDRLDKYFFSTEEDGRGEAGFRRYITVASPSKTRRQGCPTSCPSVRTPAPNMPSITFMGRRRLVCWTWWLDSSFLDEELKKSTKKKTTTTTDQLIRSSRPPNRNAVRVPDVLGIASKAWRGGQTGSRDSSSPSARRHF
ncbi:uncharacterized protein LOC144209946 [Stigmatopora nigra]